MSAVKFFILTSAQYAAMEPKDDGTLYFVSDQNRIYKGTVPYSHPIELVDEFPAAGLVGTLYVNTATKEGKAWNGSAWVTVQLAVSTTLDDSDEAIPTSKAVKEYVDGAVENIVAALELDYVVAVPRMERYMEVSAKIYSVYLKYVSPGR